MARRVRVTRASAIASAKLRIIVELIRSYRHATIGRYEGLWYSTRIIIMLNNTLCRTHVRKCTNIARTRERARARERERERERKRTREEGQGERESNSDSCLFTIARVSLP